MHRFLGWALSKSADSPDYHSSDSFERNEDTTMYAVWAEPDFILPASLTSIEEEAFEGGVFRSVQLSENTGEIGNRAFALCDKITWIYIPEATTCIHEHAFDGIEELLILGVPGSRAESYAAEHGFTFQPTV